MKQHILILLGLAVLCLQSATAAGWQIITSPNSSRQVNELHSVSALAENDVWAVGVSYNIERTLGSTLIEHWNGSRWSVVPSPNPSGTLNILYGRGGGRFERCVGGRLRGYRQQRGGHHALERLGLEHRAKPEPGQRR